jgi:hypothetical protein
MPALTRRRDPDANQETWLIHYDDIRVGSIAMRTGVPIDKDQWGWNVGFYPASDRGLRASGTAKTFDAARAIFDMAWQWLLPKFTEADFTDYRRHRAFDAWKRAMWDAGSNCRRRWRTVGQRASVVRRSESRIWKATSMPRTWRAHEVRRAPPLC